MNFVRNALMALALICGSAASVANAGLAYSIQFSPTTPTTGNAGTPWSVDVFLHETFIVGDTPVLTPITGVGILGAGYDVTLAQGTSTTTVSTATGNNAFDVVNTIESLPTSVKIAELQNFGSPGLTGTVVSPTEYSLYIGTINGTFGGSGDATLSFDITTPDWYLDGNGSPIVPNLGGNITLTSITAVPEPTSTLLTLIGFALAGLCRQRRNSVG